MEDFELTPAAFCRMDSKGDGVDAMEPVTFMAAPSPAHLLVHCEAHRGFTPPLRKARWHEMRHLPSSCVFKSICTSRSLYSLAQRCLLDRCSSVDFKETG